MNTTICRKFIIVPRVCLESIFSVYSIEYIIKYVNKQINQYDYL